MRSGNGRHRRPRQAPALLVTAGVTGAGIAMPLLGASAASAADAETWDRVADCESGGLWSANADNGYYGGLQLTLETWEQYGGTAYAERPDLASRSQQITVAEEIFEDQGPDAWPSCSVSAGLTEDSTEDPDVDPGGILDPIFEPPASSEPDDTETPAPSETPSEPETTPTDDGSSQPSSPSESADPSESTEPSDETSPGSDAPGDGESPQETGTPTPEQPAESGGKHRGPSEEERSPDREERSSRDKQQDGEGDYRVRSGDSLSAIAAERGVEGGWPALYEANREVVGGDPDLILPGQRLEF